MRRRRALAGIVEHGFDFRFVRDDVLRIDFTGCTVDRFGLAEDFIRVFSL